MNILKSKKGIGLPVVLAIVAFVLGTTATFLSYIFFQARLSDIQIEESETYANAVSDVRGALYMIARDQSLDEAYLLQIESLMNVNIESYGENLYTVSSNLLVGSRTVTSYLTGSVSSLNTYDSIFQYTGLESNFELSDFVTPSNFLTQYLNEYFQKNSFDEEVPTSVNDVESAVTFLKSLSDFTKRNPSYLNNNPNVATNLFITSNTTISTNKTINIAPNRLLVIEGNLTLNQGASIYGNVIVKGDVYIAGPNKKINSMIVGSLYVGGDFETGPKTILGQDNRPTFIMVEGTVNLGNNTTGEPAYILADNIYINNSSIEIEGGTYAFTGGDINTNKISTFDNLDVDKLYDYAIPTVITVESVPGEEGELGFIFTTPKLS